MDNYYSPSFLDKKIKISKWYLSFRFPFLHKIDFNGSINDAQRIINTQFNLLIENRKVTLSKIYENN